MWCGVDIIDGVIGFSVIVVDGACFSVNDVGGTNAAITGGAIGFSVVVDGIGFSAIDASGIDAAIIGGIGSDHSFVAWLWVWPYCCW